MNYETPGQTNRFSRRSYYNIDSISFDLQDRELFNSIRIRDMKAKEKEEALKEYYEKCCNICGEYEPDIKHCQSYGKY